MRAFYAAVSFVVCVVLRPADAQYEDVAPECVPTDSYVSHVAATYTPCGVSSNTRPRLTSTCNYVHLFSAQQRDGGSPAASDHAGGSGRVVRANGW